MCPLSPGAWYLDVREENEMEDTRVAVPTAGLPRLKPSGLLMPCRLVNSHVWKMEDVS